MENFTIYNPTQLVFGKNVLDKLGELTVPFGKTVLLMTGKGSVKKYGYFDQVLNQLQSAGCRVIEYDGIKPNPLVDDVEKASQIAMEENVSVIVALGGGSVIDSAKIVSVCAASELDPWKVMTWKAKPKAALPLITVLTLAATGTEMNDAAVLQNLKTAQKIGYVSPLLYPKISFLDPTLTITVPKKQTAYGIVDLIAHSLEAYFGDGESPLADRFVFSILSDAIENAPLLLNNLTDYELRAKIMLDATCALNGITTYGKKVGDWGVHGLGHELSLLYDLPHGATLSIAYPAWMKLHAEKLADKITKLGQNVFKTKDVNETITHFEKIFESIDSPINLKQAGISALEADTICKQMIKNQVSGIKHKLNADDLKTIVQLMTP